MGHLVSFGLQVREGLINRAEGASLTEHEQPAVRRAAHLHRRHVVGDAPHLLGPQLDHLLVVLRVIAHIPVWSALESPPILCSRPGVPGPRPGQGLGVPRVGKKLALAVGGRMPRGDLGQLPDVRQFPGLGAVGQKSWREAPPASCASRRSGWPPTPCGAIRRVLGASTQTGDSPFRPNMAWRRSVCSVLVGIPVLGPERWTSTTRGNSVITARFSASDFRQRPSNT